MAENDGVPSLDCEIVKDNLNEGIKKIVQKLRPKWNADKLVIESKSDGFTNVNYAVTSGSGCRDGLFVRLVNQDMPGLIEMNTSCMRYLKRRKLGAQLLLTFKNGLVMEMLDGEPVTWQTVDKLKQKYVWSGLAREVARYHGTTNETDIKELGVAHYEEMNEKFKMILQMTADSVSFDLKAHGLPDVEGFFELKKKVYASLFEDGATLAFCHMDANPTNVLITKDGPVLIDYEFCLYDLPFVHIATLFGSMSNINNFNIADLPNEEEQDVFIREYLRVRAKLDPKFGPANEELFKYWKFMVKKANLPFCLSASVGTLLLEGIGTKGVDLNLLNLFWNMYKENEHLLNTKYK